MRAAALCVLVVLTALVPARAQLVLDPAQPADRLADHAGVAEGWPERVGAADVRPVASLSPYALPETFSLRIPLRATAAAEWIVPLSYDDVTAVLVHADGRRDVSRTGARVPRAQHTTRLGRPAGIRIALGAGESAVLVLRVHHRAGGYADVIDPRPVEAEAFIADRRGSDVTNGLALGVFLALAVYNLFLFVTFRDRSYLYYVGFLVGSIAYWDLTWGFVAEFVLPPSRVLVPELQLYALAASAISYVQFVRHFLRTRVHAPRADVALRIAIGIWMLAPLVGLAGSWPVGQLVAAAGGLALLASTFTSGVLTYRAGFRPALAYLTAASPFVMIGTTFAVLFAMDPARGGEALPWFQAAVAAEALGLALALVVRVRALRLERSEAVVAREASEAARAASEAARETLREANDLKTHLIGVVAHDLRSPLTSVSGAAELMELEAEHQPDLLELAALVRSGSARMLALVDDLLVTAALDSGTIALRPAPTHLATLVAEVVGAYASRASEKAQTLVLDAPCDALVVAVDAERVRAILDNLVSNAVKYTPLGGRVSVACAEDADGLRVAVSDTGPGLSPEDTAALFQRFRRLSAAPTGGESSTGLGLAIASEFAALHGGRIDVESVLGAGTTFTLVLPASVLLDAKPAHAVA